MAAKVSRPDLFGFLLVGLREEFFISCVDSISVTNADSIEQAIEGISAQKLENVLKNMHARTNHVVR